MSGIFSIRLFIKRSERLLSPILKFIIKVSVQDTHLQRLSIMSIKTEIFKDITNVTLSTASKGLLKTVC